MRSLPRSVPTTILTSAWAFLAIAGITHRAAAQLGRGGSDSTTSADTLARSRIGAAFAPAVIIPDSIDRAPITSFSDLLQARVPGLSVQRISGASGAASRIRIRGTRSSLYSSTPLVIVDGLRVEVTAPRFQFLPSANDHLDTEWWSQLDDLDPEDIQRVEVFSGPAAASRFGRGASSGVIVVTTKRGLRDGFHWSAHGSFGTVSQATDFPASYDQRGIDGATGAHIDYCGIVAQSRLTCAPIPDSLLSSNALELDSPFRTGTRSEVGLNGSGGNDHASLFVAGDFTREDGDRLAG